MRAPRFWSDPRPGLAARLLQPVGLAYSAVAEMRMRVLPCARSLVPVICVGNPTLGGAGKTPVAIAIAQRVTRRGTRPGFLSRGYGAAITDPVVVDPAGSAQAYGDEPLLLAREATTVCCPDRPRGADLLVRNGVGTIIMDDGFQNPSLAKDLSFLVVDARAGLGNGLVFPAGPLRMRLLPQIARASALIVVGTAEPGAHLVRVAERRGLPIMRARLIPDPQAVEALRERPLLAFAGIGRPEKFFDTLRAQGLEIAARQAFADHHEYSAADAHNLLQRARELGATLVTTQKDAVRFSGAADGALGELRAAAMTLPVHAEFDIVSLRNLELLLDTVPALARSKP